MQSVSKNEIKFVFKDLLGNFLYFPFWWYSVGLKRTLVFCVDSVKLTNDRLGLTIWVKNLFVPMYGQYDWQGKIISFFLRLFMIIIKSVFMFVWIIIIFIYLLFWLLLPVFVLFQIIYHSTVAFVS